MSSTIVRCAVWLSLLRARLFHLHPVLQVFALALTHRLARPLLPLLPDDGSPREFPFWPTLEPRSGDPVRALHNHVVNAHARRPARSPAVLHFAFVPGRLPGHRTNRGDLGACLNRKEAVAAMLQRDPP